MNKGKEGRSKIPLSEFLDIAAARHRTRLPATLQTAAGRISKNDVNTHRKTARSSTRLHYDVVESSGKGKGTSKPKDKPRKRRHNNNSS
ncbi:MAG: hypothetical protein JO297_07310 [Nitrososphaeraceae archaeon]|nr:hypothetical protein [Nitrososphaeraceae archaeon]